MRRSLLSALLFLFTATIELHAQRTTLSASLTAGTATPIGPSRLTDQWYSGHTVSGSVELNLNRSLSTGIQFDYTDMPNYGTPLAYRYGSLPCIGGGNRIFSSFSMTTKAYVWNYRLMQFYLAGDVGVANNVVTPITYRNAFGPYTLSGISTINMAGAVRIGGDMLVDDRVAVRVDVGYVMIEDGFVLNQFIPIRMGLLYHWSMSR